MRVNPHALSFLAIIRFSEAGLRIICDNIHNVLKNSNNERTASSISNLESFHGAAKFIAN